MFLSDGRGNSPTALLTFDKHTLTFMRVVSNATLSSEDENEREPDPKSIPKGCLKGPAHWITGSPEHVSPVSQLMNRGSRSTTLHIPHGTVDADPLIDADTARAGAGPRHLARSTACPFPERIGPNNWCTETGPTIQSSGLTQQRGVASDPVRQGEHTVQPYGHRTDILSHAVAHAPSSIQTNPPKLAENETQQVSA